MSRTAAWDWNAAAAAAGITPEGIFNCASLDFSRGSLVWVREDLTVIRRTGESLIREAMGLAGALQRLGVRRGDRVASSMSRRPESLTLPLATWALGAIYVPIFSGFGSDAVGVRLGDCQPLLFVVDETTAHMTAALDDLGSGPEVVSLDANTGPQLSLRAIGERLALVAEIARTHMNDPATIMYTSGTTGLPKGCIIPHKGILSLWPYVDSCLAMTRDDLLFSTADPGWSFGLYTTGVAPLSRGRDRVLYEGAFDPGRWWEIIRRFGISHFASAPTGFRQLMLHGKQPAEVGRLRDATSAGEPLDEVSFRWFDDELGIAIHDSYGLTELGMVIANLRVGKRAPKPRSMGTVVPGFEARVVDQSGGEIAIGEAGRLAVKENGFLLGRGYWDRDSEWDGHWLDDWWVTEDVVHEDGEGFFTYIGRNDDVVVTAGYNVGPSEVESVVLAHPLITDAACLGEHDARKGQCIVLFVVASGEKDEGAVTEEIRELVGKRIGWHAAPKRVEFVDALPRTESGKIIRAKLRSAVPRTHS